MDELEDLASQVAALPVRKKLALLDKSGMRLHPHDVGIGISQVLPVIVLALDRETDFAAIEQPELHVHPRVQVGLGDMFISKLHGNPSSRLLIETHSEHMILRILRRIRETGEDKPANGVAVTGADVAVYYVFVRDGCTSMRRIEIDKKGEFVQPWPDDFFEIDFYERFGDAR